MALENGLDFQSDFFIGRLHGSGRSGAIIAASG
jgi:hypothetical protein